MLAPMPDLHQTIADIALAVRAGVQVDPSDRRARAAREAIAEAGLTLETFQRARAECDEQGVCYRRVTTDALLSGELGPQLGDEPVGIGLRHVRRPDLWAMITLSASEPGRFQLTWADARGPSGHTARDTLEQVIRVATEEGYRDLDFASPRAAGDLVAFEIEETERDRIRLGDLTP